MTYSIVARDPATGQLGVAVQSHWLSVGSLVSWARSGVGAVATQATGQITYGPLGLDGLAAGGAPENVLARLCDADPGAESRQVAMVDARGRVAVHTGAECIPCAGHAVGDGVCCQANMMVRPTVWDAMLAAYETAGGPLAQRLLAALDAAEAQGGDIRGRQSAALLVAPAEGEPWRTMIDLRVEDAAEPLEELRRLLRLHEAYELAAEGDELATPGRGLEAAARYRQAAELAPESQELRFWGALGAARAGDPETALREMRAVIALHPPWQELLTRLTGDLAPAARDLAARLGAG